MGTSARLDIEDKDILRGIQDFLAAILKTQQVEALLVPKWTAAGHGIMPVLVHDPEQLAGVDPLSPVFPLNAARQVSKLTKKPSGKKIAAVLRPCEIRALVELAKLKQADLSSVILISADCPGAYSNKEWASQGMARETADPAGFFQKRMSGRDLPVAPACDTCEEPVSARADIQIGLVGMDIDNQLLVTAQSPEGEALLQSLSLQDCPEPDGRGKQLETYIGQRTAAKNKLFEETRERTDSLSRLDVYFEACVNCYNCRVACPVCYCRECVFNTDVFDHDPFQYLVWARRKGAVKLPSDTLFFHLTRLAHMSLSCVGCGQCSNACPNDIRVADLFKLVADDAQAAFAYRAGADPEQALPMSEFRENEFHDVVGI